MLRILLLVIAGAFIVGIIIAGIRQKKRMNNTEEGSLEKSVKDETLPQIRDIEDIDEFDGYDDDQLSLEAENELQAKTRINEYVAPLLINHVSNEIKAGRDEKEAKSSVLDDSVTDHDKLILFYIMAPKGKKFIGYELYQTLIATGMQHGESGMFHYYDQVVATGKDATMFTLAALNDTGEIDINSIGGFATTGLCVFLNIKYKNPQFAFKTMLRVLQQLNEDLDGQILDLWHKPCTQQYLEYSYQKIVKYVASKAQIVPAMN